MVTVDVVLQRKAPGLAAFVLVPAAAVAAWGLTATTTVEGTIDGVPLGRRSLHRWDDERWFVELTGSLLRAIGKDVGDRVTLAIAPASTELPAELAALIASEPAAAARWKGLTPAQQRMLREEVGAAKSAATRDRRARKVLLPAEVPPAPAVEGLGAPRSVLLRIVARELPGATCGRYTDVRVGLATKVGCDPDETVPADVPEVTWETRIDVLAKDGRPHFRGPAVNGPTGERFVYLTWTHGAPPAMFRRAKLRLDAVPAEVLARALRSGVLVGRLGLTAPDGLPRCASVLPPVLSWSAG